LSSEWGEFFEIVILSAKTTLCDTVTVLRTVGGWRAKCTGIAKKCKRAVFSRRVFFDRLGLLGFTFAYVLQHCCKDCVLLLIWENDGRLHLE